MSETERTWFSGVERTTTEFIPVVLRAIVTVILTPFAVLKFADYSGQAAAFADYGIPAPEITVILVGAVQLLAAVLIALGAAGRVGALVMVPILVTAILTAGIYATNVTVLLGCVGIVLLGTGNYSVWNPET